MLLQDLVNEVKSNTQDAFLRLHSEPALVFAPSPSPTPRPKFNPTETLDDSDSLQVHMRREQLPPYRAITEFGATASIGNALRNKGHVVFVTKSGRNSLLDFITVGRTDDNDIIISNDNISRVHAFFVKTGAGFWMVVDQNSTNGTTLNSEKLKSARPYRLIDGSQLSFGKKVEAIFLLPQTLWTFLRNY